MFKQYQEVELSHDMMSDELLGDPVQLKEGQKGVIVEIHTSKGIPYKGYDVEFFDDSGNTVAVMIVKEDDIRPTHEKHVRKADPAFRSEERKDSATA